MGYVWCEICVGYVWCEIRQQSSEEPCDETSFGKKTILPFKLKMLGAIPPPNAHFETKQTQTLAAPKVEKCVEHGGRVQPPPGSFTRRSMSWVAAYDGWHLKLLQVGSTIATGKIRWSIFFRWRGLMVDFYGAPKVFRWVFLLLHKIQLFVFAVLGVKIRFFFNRKKNN